MYLDRAFGEDKAMVESWKGDAEGMLVFVSLPASSYPSMYNVEIVDWSVLRCCCDIAPNVHWEYSAEPASYHKLLSRVYLPATEWSTTSSPERLELG